MWRKVGILVIAIAALGVALFFFLYTGILGPLARYPYIESLTSQSAEISWATDDIDSADLRLFSPDGETRVLKSAAPSQIHTVHLTQLAPETVYRYRIFLNGGPISDEYSFKTAPSRDDAPVRFFVVGDSGKGNRAQYQVARRIERLLEKERLDFGLHTGDVIYGDTARGSDQDKRYFLPYHRILSRVPLWLALGNHDVGRGKLKPILDLHTLPGNERWYSFDYGPVHVVILDSCVSGSEEQRRWLEKDLASNRNHPWTFAVFHYPPYAWPYADRTPDEDSQGSYLKVRKAWSPIFERYGVDMVFNGHNHSYQRTRLIQDYELDGKGIYYIVTGGGGGRLHPIAKDRTEPGLIVKCVDKTYHFVLISIQGNRLSLEAIDRYGKVFDRFSFTKDSTPIKNKPVRDL